MCIFRSLLEEYERNMTGKTANKLRWKTCVSLVDEGLRAAVGKMYVLKHFKEPSKLDMIEMVKYIREEFAKIIDQVVQFSVCWCKKLQLRIVQFLSSYYVLKSSSIKCILTEYQLSPIKTCTIYKFPLRSEAKQ